MAVHPGVGLNWEAGSSEWQAVRDQSQAIREATSGAGSESPARGDRPEIRSPPSPSMAPAGRPDPRERRGSGRPAGRETACFSAAPSLGS